MRSEYPFSAGFSMFTPAGLRINFAVAADTAEAHLAELRAYLGQLDASGFSVNIPGVEDGEKLEAIDGWVLGETSKKETCVFLFSANHGLQWRVATVYVEKLGELPFSGKGAKLWPGDAAPSRETAEAKGYMMTVPEFRIVMTATGKMTEAGNPIYKFARVFDAEPKPKSVKAEKPAPAQPEPKPAAPVQMADIYPPADPDNDADWGDGDGSTDKPFTARPEWTSPMQAQQWAVDVGACANSHEARQSWVKVVGGKSVGPDALPGIYDAYYARQMEKLNPAA